MSGRGDGYAYWQDHFNVRGRIRFLIHPDVLTSDEAIVGTFAHEMFELAEIREVFMASPLQRMNAEDYRLQVTPGFKDNFHDQAWDAADAAVLRMREAQS